MDIKKLKEIAKHASTATIADIMHQEPYKFIMEGITPQTDKVIFGEAVTLKSLPFRPDLAADIKEKAGVRENFPFEQALELAADGKVLVIDASGYDYAAVGGDVKLSRLHNNGAAGLVTDGSVRDKEEIITFDYGLFCAGFTPMSGTNYFLVGAELNVPISCGKVLVRPGDFIFGDVNGIVVIPKGKVKEVIPRAAKKEALDTYIREKIAKDNVNPGKYYPPNEELKKEFEEWYASNK